MADASSTPLLHQTADAAAPRVAVVGLGHWGPNIARNLDRLGALAAIADRDAARRDALGERYPAAATFAGLEDVLAEGKVDAVAIATPPATHGPLCRMALEAGKHVFVEKPLCLDLAEAEALRALADARGLTLMVGHLLLYHAAFRKLKEVVAEGRVGTLRYVYSHRLSLGKIRREENALWSFAPHDVSMILSLLGRMPERVTTSGGVYLSPPVADTTLSHLTFADGVQAHIFVSWLHPYKEHRMVLVGSDGMLVFNDVNPASEKLLFYPHRVGWDGDIPAVNKAEAEPVAIDTTEPLLEECRHFLNCVAERQSPVSDAAEAIRVLTVLDACQRSLTAGQPVTL